MAWVIKQIDTFLKKFCTGPDNSKYQDFLLHSIVAIR